MGRVQRTVALVAAVAMTAVLTACGSDSAGSKASTATTATALTQEQAELFATVRFRNFDAGVRALTVTIPDQKLEGAASGGKIVGWMDFAQHTGFASVDQGGKALGLMVWNGDRLAVNESKPGPATLPIAQDGWRSQQLDATASPMTQALTVVLNLASDRPENPLLLRQSDAAFLRNDSIGQTPVVVLAGPSQATSSTAPEATRAAPDANRIRYWIAADGMLMRVQLKLTGTADWATIDFAEADDITLDIKQITGILTS